MTYSTEKMQELAHLVEQHSPQDGVNLTSIPDVGTLRAPLVHGRRPILYDPMILILAQGGKFCYLDGQRYDISVGNYMSLFLPMPLETEITEASVDKPVLMAGIKVDLNKIATILLKLDQLEQPYVNQKPTSASGIFSKPVDDDLLSPTVKLFQTLDNPADRSIVSEAIIEEIYYRVICHDQTDSLRQLLQQRGQIQQISKAVNHIHSHINQVTSIDELAELVGMSSSGFHKSFKEVMHLSPLQYAKSIKLYKAQALIREGKSASEAGYLVGYNSPAQFSREYKRCFGFAPSAT